MAKVPTLDESEVQLKPTPVDPKTAATLGGEIVDVGQGLSSIGDSLEKLKDLTQKTQQLSALSDDFINIHNQAFKDLDVWSAPERYSDAYQKAVEARAKNIDSAAARDEYMNEASRMAAVRSISTDQMLIGRQSQEAKASVTNAGQSFLRDISAASDEGHRAMARQQFSDTIDAFKNNGFIHPAQAENYKQNWLYHGEVATAMRDATHSPQTVLDEFNKIDSGKGSNIYKTEFTEQDAEKIKSKAARQIVINDNNLKKNMKNIQERNARDLDYMFRTHNPNIQEHAEELYYTGQINKQTFDNYTGGNKKASLVDPQTDGTSYVEALAYIADPKTSVSDARDFIMKKYNQNLIAPDDRNRLYDLAIRPMGGEYKSIKDIIGLENSKKDESYTFKRFVNGALDLFHNYAPFARHLPSGKKGAEKSDDKSVQMAKNFIKKILDNNTPPNQYLKEANDIINQQRLMDRPEISQYPADGQTEQDENGIRSTVNPDGSTSQEDQSGMDNIDAGY
jgi:hypothetical protein